MAGSAAWGGGGGGAGVAMATWESCVTWWGGPTGRDLGWIYRGGGALTLCVEVATMGFTAPPPPQKKKKEKKKLGDFCRF